MSLFTKKAYVGLDIGHHTLRAVQVERTASGWRVAKSASAPTPEDTVRDGVVIDPPVLGLAIKNMLKGAHISATSASIAISGGTVVVRPVRLPKMAESALRKSIRFEASRYVPNSVEDSYIEFEIIGDVDATNMDVIIAAAPKELVDSRVAACEKAGLEVEHVELATFAAYRSIIEADHGHDWADKTIGLVDIGAAVTNLGVISNGGFSMTRAIPAGGQVLTDALKSYFKLSTEDAESGKGQLDIRGLLNEASVAENPPLRILHTHVDDLVREVRRSINYWQSQQTEMASAKHVDVIVLCGGGSNLPGLAEYFQHKLGIETLALGVFDNSRFIASHSNTGHGLEMAVAVGLAMGLASSHAVVRDSKPVSVNEAESAKSPKPPKEPKPAKPTKIRTSKVARPAEAPLGEAEAIGSTEGVEIAASMPLPSAVPESVPLVAKAMNDEPTLGSLQHAELEESEVMLSGADEVQQFAVDLPKNDFDTEEKYGAELATLIGAFESDPVAAMPPPTPFEVVPPAQELDEIVQPLSWSQRMASGRTATPTATEAVELPEPPATPGAQDIFDAPIAEAAPFCETPPMEELAEEMSLAQPPASEIPAPSVVAEMPETVVVRSALLGNPVVSTPIPTEATEVPETSETTISPEAFDAPFAETPPAEMPPVQAPVAEIPATPMAAEVPEEWAARSALLANPVASTINGQIAAPRGKGQKKSLFSIGKKAEKKPKPLKAERVGKPAREIKTKKPLFARAPKAEKVSKSLQSQRVEGAPAESALKKAAAWLFGGPKQQNKPSEKLIPKSKSSGADLNPVAVASRDAQIEFLRGSSLEFVDTTLVDANAEEPTSRPEPEFAAAEKAPKAKARKIPVSKKPQTTDSEPDSKEEAA